MSFEGSLQDRQLGEVLLALGREAQTGILTIQGEHEIIAFSMLAGEVVSADALNQTLEDGLGRVLATLGLVPPDRFAELAAEQQSGGGQVIDLLQERSYLDPKQLWEALRIHTYRLCLQALSWNHGEYKFYRGDEVSHEEGMSPIPVEELLIRASRDLGGGAGLLDGRIPEARSVYGRTPEAFGGDEGPRGDDPIQQLATVDLGEEAGRIFSLVNGSRSVAELAASSGSSEYKVAFCLSRWERAGLVRVESADARAAEPAPAAAPISTPAEALGVPPDRVGAAQPPPPERAGGRRKGRKEPRPRTPRTPPGIQPWPARVLGLALGALFVGLAFFDPSSVLLPYPWQESLRADLDKDRRAVSYLKVQRTAEVFFLLRGRYPDELAPLAELGLLAPADLEDPAGGPIEWEATEVSYLLRSAGGEGAAETARTGSVTGNFLLDPDFEVPETTGAPPLVLLD